MGAMNFFLILMLCFLIYPLSYSFDIKDTVTGGKYWLTNGCFRDKDFDLTCIHSPFFVLVTDKSLDLYPVFEVLSGAKIGATNDCYKGRTHNECDDNLEYMKVTTPTPTNPTLFPTPKLYKLSEREVYVCVKARMVTLSTLVTNQANDFLRGQSFNDGFIYKGSFSTIAGKNLGLFETRSPLGLHDPGCDIKGGDYVILYGTEIVDGEVNYIIKSPKVDSYLGVKVLSQYFSYISKYNDIEFVRQLTNEQANQLLE